MKNLLTVSIFLTTLIVITSFAPKDANAACWKNAYGNIQCSDGSVYDRGNYDGQYNVRDGRGNIQQRCGIDYLGRYSCN